MYVYRNTEMRSRNQFAFVIQNAKRVRRFIFSCGLPGFTPPPPIYHINRTILGGEKLLHLKCVLIFCTTFFSDTFLIIRRIQRDTNINVRTSSCKIPVILTF